MDSRKGNAAVREFLPELRSQLLTPGNGLREVVGWDSSNVSRVLNGQQGVPIEKIEALIKAAGFVVVDKRFYEAMCTLAEYGVAYQQTLDKSD